MDSLASPWHGGERTLHRRLGITDQMEAVGQRSIRNFMPDQHRTFFAQLPFFVLGSADRDGGLWASLLDGPPGFVSSPEPRHLEIAALPDAADKFAQSLTVGAPIGALGIDLSVRRRNRVNGRVTRIDDRGFTLAIEQSFGNCPKYIARRDVLARAPAAPVRAEAITGFDAEALTLIGAATTFFVASAHAAGALPDVSHRGGRPGFIGIGADSTLTIPDYTGNFHFSTLGNMLLNPRIGLLFPDFATGDLLQLTGAGELDWDGPDIAALPGAQRLWRFRPSHGQWLHNAMRLRFAEPEDSPFSPVPSYDAKDEQGEH
jgi:predicted pyridoxine 5'-phosphate oxidase superfamily flavin-nucleotide-binding protein